MRHVRRSSRDCQRPHRGAAVRASSGVPRYSIRRAAHRAAAVLRAATTEILVGRPPRKRLRQLGDSGHEPDARHRRERTARRGLPVSERLHAGGRQGEAAGVLLDSRRRLHARLRFRAAVRRLAAGHARRRRRGDDPLSPRRARLSAISARTAARSGAPPQTRASSIRSPRSNGCATTSRRSAATRPT